MDLSIEQQITQTPAGIWVLKNDTHLSRWIEQAGTLEVAGDIARFAQYIKPGMTVVDAGASLGDHTATYARLVGPTGYVLAFEPNPIAFECLKRNMADKPWVKCINAALSDHEGREHIAILDNAGASFIGSADESHPSVTVTQLDLFKAEPGRPIINFIHLDAEGSEVEILIGATQVLTQDRPVIVLEVNLGALGRQGFHQDNIYHALDQMNYRWEELDEGAGKQSEQRDIICFPR